MPLQVCFLKKSLLKWHVIKKWIFCLFIFSLAPSSGAADCGFNTPGYKSEKSSKNRVPLLISSDQFSTKTQDQLKSRISAAKQKFAESIKKGPSICEQKLQRAKSIYNKILSKTQLHDQSFAPPELVILCSKKKMAPLAKNIAGHFILVPYSLVHESVDEDAIAAVLAHELAHSTLQHHSRLIEEVEKKSKNISHGEFNSIKEGHEVEADHTGLELLSQANYDPGAAIKHLVNVDQKRYQGFKNGAFDKDYALDGAVSEPIRERVQRLKTQISNCKYSEKVSDTSH